MGEAGIFSDDLLSEHDLKSGLGDASRSRCMIFPSVEASRTAMYLLGCLPSTPSLWAPCKRPKTVGTVQSVPMLSVPCMCQQESPLGRCVFLSPDAPHPTWNF